MPYRTMTVEYSDGTVERIRCRISDEAFREWLAEREQLRALGSPDRPPDVDNDFITAWAQVAGEENHPYFQPGATPVDIEATGKDEICLAISWRTPELPDTKLIVMARGDGSFDVRCFTFMGPEIGLGEAGHVIPADASLEDTNDDLQTAMANIAEAMPWEPDAALIHTYADTVAVDAELELAKAEWLLPDKTSVRLN